MSEFSVITRSLNYGPFSIASEDNSSSSQPSSGSSVILTRRPWYIQELVISVIVNLSRPRPLLCFTYSFAVLYVQLGLEAVLC